MSRREKRRLCIIVITALLMATLGKFIMNKLHPEILTLSLHLGEELSHFKTHATYPFTMEDDRGKGNYYFTIADESKPVIIEYSDPKHGFVLPPTIFLAADFKENQLVSITTSPQVKTLNLASTLHLVHELFDMLEKGGWQVKKRYTSLETLPQKLENAKGEFAVQTWCIGYKEIVMRIDPDRASEMRKLGIPNAEDLFLIKLEITDFPSLRNPSMKCPEN